MNLRTLDINNSWTLFLDRDGVINRQKADDYVRNWDEFEFLPGVVEGFPLLNAVFGHIFIVTNQQGIGKGLMSADDLDNIHQRMLEIIARSGGKIDQVYVSPYLSQSRHFDRKPSIGMALKARKEFGIDLKKSVMAGDSLTDMIFGRRAGMITVLIRPDPQLARKYHKIVDYRFDTLMEFAKEFELLPTNLLKQSEKG